MATATKGRQKMPCPECHRSYSNLGLHMRLAHVTGEPQKPQEAAPRPGTVVGEGAASHKVPYTMRAMEEIYGMYLWDDPPEDIPITVNSITVWIKAGVPIRLPKVFYDVYRDSVAERRNVNVFRQAGDVTGIVVSRGAGPILRAPETAP